MAPAILVWPCCPFWRFAGGPACLCWHFGICSMAPKQWALGCTTEVKPATPEDKCWLKRFVCLNTHNNHSFPPWSCGASLQGGSLEAPPKLQSNSAM
eukprot:2977234-Amphidinium_carterae.1